MRVCSRLVWWASLALLSGTSPAFLGATGEAAGLREINAPPASGDSTPLALVGVRWFDGGGRGLRDEGVVVVRGARIAAVGGPDETAIPTGADVRDGSGLTVLPGLIDAHMHTINDLATPALFLSHGVTAFRDPGHPFRFYQAVLQTDKVMPRVFLCGAHLDAYPPIWPQQALIVKDAEHARQAVREHVARGASAIKIYFRLPLEYYQPICDEAAELGVPVTAHLELVDADEAVRAGVRGIEHVTSFGTALAEPSRAAEFKSAVRQEPNVRRDMRFRLWSNLDLDTQRAEELIALIVERDVIISPTLAIFERRAGDPNTSGVHVEAFTKMLRFVGMCHQAGAKVVVGSHTHAPHAEFGWAYQRELELLVEAGLAPNEALRAATRTNAIFFGVEDRLGTLEPGKLADLILVEGDPTEDIRAMYQVRHIMLNGRWVGEAAPKTRRP